MSKEGANFSTVRAQDLFETRLLSMDTDFRMFSSDYMGRLPGIDIAQVMDGAAYHSKHDTVDRIRKGTIQVSDLSSPSTCYVPWNLSSL